MTKTWVIGLSLVIGIYIFAYMAMRVCGLYQAELHQGWVVKPKYNNTAVFILFSPLWILDNTFVDLYMPEPQGG